MKLNAEQLNDLNQKIVHHLDVIYESVTELPSMQLLASELIEIMRLDTDSNDPMHHHNSWDQTDIIMITYGDSVLEEGFPPLKSLDRKSVV